MPLRWQSVLLIGDGFPRLLKQEEAFDGNDVSTVGGEGHRICQGPLGMILLELMKEVSRFCGGRRGEATLQDPRVGLGKADT